MSMEHINASKNIDFLSRGGETFDLVTRVDWVKTSIGSPDGWPQSLRSALSICFNSNFPIAVYWGRELILLYNEAWSPIPGEKHPWAFGKRAIDVWPEIWADIEPQFQKAFNGSPGGSKDALLPLQRHGYTEECYFDFTFTPVYGESGAVEGIFNAVIETTYRVINERRGAILQKLGEAINGLGSEEEVFKATTDILQRSQKDVPVFFIYEWVSGGTRLRAHSQNAQLPSKEWPFLAVHESGHPLLVNNLNDYFENVPAAYWPEPLAEAIIVPLKSNDGNTSGFIVGGISARRRFDKEYQRFFDSISNIVSGELNTLRSLIRERERAESLAQLDRAKTAFFSNISHEFRTPLTLMAGPLEEVVNSADYLLTDHKRHLDTALRNTFRLQRLVNNLLDFSRIEAGKFEVNVQPVDIGLLTKDLASSFRSAIESAGIAYEVSVSDIEGTVLIDPDVWEKIVLNLISNSFKYTEKGKITVSLYEEDNILVLNVSDTGVGIAQEHLARVFERFYRVNSQGARSQEGTGIGLAMVKELVALHKGEVTVESKVGEGSIFTARIPKRKGNAQGAGSMTSSYTTSRARRAFIDEAAMWNGSSALLDAQSSHTSTQASGPRIIVADDNIDMRQYITRLLSGQFEIIAVANGQEAFERAQEIIPDLIISDIMMPRVDGLQLLKKLKSSMVTRNIPVIFLSARAGEEARVEGIQAGADDYLIKPFSGRELVARVANCIAVNKTRTNTVRQFFNLFSQCPAYIHVFTGPEHIVEFFHPLGKKVIGRDITGMKVREALPELAGQGFFDALDRVYHEGKTISIPESKAMVPDADGNLQVFYLNITYSPWRDLDGAVKGVLEFTFDITQQSKAHHAVRESEERFRTLANSIPHIVWIATPTGEIEYLSDQWSHYTRMSADEGRRVFSSLIHHEDIDAVRAKWHQSLKDKTTWTSEFRLKNIETGNYTWFFGQTTPIIRDGQVMQWIGSAADIHRQKTLHFELEELVSERTEELLKLNKILIERNDELAKAQNFLQTVLDSSVELVTSFDKDLNFTFVNRRVSAFSELTPEQLIGKNLLDVHPGFEKSEGYQQLMRALSGELVHIEARRAYTDNSLVFETFMIPLRHHGQVTGVVTMQRDISAIVRLSENLKASNEMLKRSNEDLQQFAHVTSHDLKEPVRKIRMYSNMLTSEFSGYLPEKGNNYLAKVQRAATRISAMIDGVLQYSTIEASEQSLEKVDLVATVKSIIEDLEIPVKEHRVKITYADLPVINAYPTLIHQLFYNLINNSIKFRRKDLIPEITIAYSAAVQDEDQKLNEDYFEISLQDNGIGFDPRYGEKIFESFTRLHPKDTYEGTGLGLALCRKIVLRHNGIIKASGELNKGARFRVFFPKTIRLS